jgi:hypothetical protein
LRGLRGMKSDWLKNWKKSIFVPTKKNEHEEDNYEELARRVQDLKDKSAKDETKSP